MREIKFRAFHFGMRYLKKPEDFSYFFGGTDGPEITLTECKLMQYTGLKDKNSKEIYEGDKVSDENGIIGIVLWNESEAQFVVEYEEELMNLWAECEVVGNIYENPELLKELC